MDVCKDCLPDLKFEVPDKVYKPAESQRDGSDPLCKLCYEFTPCLHIPGEDMKGFDTLSEPAMKAAIEELFWAYAYVKPAPEDVNALVAWMIKEGDGYDDYVYELHEQTATDTFPRDVIIDALCLMHLGEKWPINGERGSERSESFPQRMVALAEKRGWEHRFELEDR